MLHLRTGSQRGQLKPDLPQLCNPGAQAPAQQGPRRFSSDAEWRRKCSALSLPATDSPLSKQNWCSEHMKHNGCYASHGTTTWYQKQSKAAHLAQICTLSVSCTEGQRWLRSDFFKIKSISQESQQDFLRNAGCIATQKLNHGRHAFAVGRRDVAHGQSLISISGIISAHQRKTSCL